MAEATPALEIRNLHKRYGELEVLKGISLTARDGDVISILGSPVPASPPSCAASTCWKTRTRARSWSPAKPSSSRPPRMAT
jgi:ABC-type phosphate transport system ATPase subunit